MKIYVARHGFTNYNELQLCNNDPKADAHLTEKGIAQAKQLAIDLKDIPFEIIYTSDLKRTKQTATYVNEYHNLDMIEDVRLGDTKTGFEGQSTSLYFAELEKAENRWTVRCNDGESLEDLKDRVKDFINYLATQDYDCVLVVTSQYIIYAFLCWLEGYTNEQAWTTDVPQASFRVFDIAKNSVL